MPELFVDVAWPDGSRQRWYSPSLVVEDHLAAGASYPVEDFVTRSRAALTEGSNRVEKLYGFPCSRAAASLAEIERNAGRFGGAGLVEVLAFHR